MSNKWYKVLPTPSGPLPTACTDLMCGRGQRGTLMKIYYPSTQEKVKDKDLSPWFPGHEYTKGLCRFTVPYMSRFIAPFMPYIFETLFNWNTMDAKIPSAFDAPIAEGTFPLIIFSHGLAAHRNMYSTICNDLASHGFFVASVEHRDESASASFTLSETGEKDWILFKTIDQNTKQFAIRNKQVGIRAAEVMRAMDVLESLNSGKIERNELPSSLDLQCFRGRVDTSNAVLAGHSFGGATTILALSKDHRFKVGIALDPWMFPLKDDVMKLAEDVKQPMLFILTEMFIGKPNFKAFLPFDLERNRFVTLKGSVHHNQSDTPFLFGLVGRLLGGAWSSLDKDLAVLLNNKLMINFICTHLGIPNIGTKVSPSVAQQHLYVGLDLESLSFEAAQEFLNFQNNNNNNTKLKRLSSRL